MRRFVTTLIVLVLAGPAAVGAWGGSGHRLILERAIPLLSPELRAVFEEHRAMLLEHASDPDLWRVAGFEEEAPRHFLDLDAYGPAPFTALPRELGGAIEKYGPETVTKNGLLPWRAAEMRGRLVRAFEAHGNGQRSALPNALYLAAVCVLPDIFYKAFNVPFYFGGTSLLIVVGVALDTVQQVESHLLMRHYEGFLKKAKVRGRIS